MTDESQKRENCILEVIALTVEDAINAERGGAGRLEVIRDFEAGGLTPPLDLVRDIKQAVNIPLRVMLRENEGYGLGEVIAMEKLCCMANALNEMKVDGVVLGFLRGDRIDLDLTRKVLGCAPGLKATFHHAFEDTIDKQAAIADLKTIPQIDKILSHGGREALGAKITNLTEYKAAAEPEIEILAGGGMNPGLIRMLRGKAGIREFHVGTAARSDGRVNSGLVSELVKSIAQEYV